MLTLTGLRLLNFLSFLFVLLARVVWHKTPTELPLAIMPAPFVDAVLGVLYTTLLIWCIRPVRSYPADRTLILDISGWFSLTMIGLGASSIVGPPWELVLMTVSFISLCLIYSKIQQHPNRSPWMRSPFSVFLAWSSVQILILPFRILRDFRFEELFGLSVSLWTSIMLIVFAGGVLVFSWFHSDWVFGVVMIWFYSGLFFNDRLTWTQEWITVIATVAVAIVTVVVFRRRQKIFSEQKTPVS
ncbi:hypothetical protein [Exiguobacterium oxidotolerans]|uniref:Uncharacterized protein n=1 Tax=Exiguobacterium oxidotolerans TaxID=223958 RepID=A0A653I4W9_9BACL|nr:hypothetical protein [Exiguobacterium oxidotolerans]VWX33788.1 conserved membrane hypothetical protein [Exiguobacterium oxidotolerans]